MYHAALLDGLDDQVCLSLQFRQASAWCHGLKGRMAFGYYAFLVALLCLFARRMQMMGLSNINKQHSKVMMLLAVQFV